MRPTRSLLLSLVLLCPLVLACGSDDDPAAPEVPATIQGSWLATSLMVEGDDLIAMGMTLSFFFGANGEYSYLVGNDLAGLCTTGMTCEEFGDFAASSSSITFDPSEGATTFTYTLSGDVMTLSGAWEGTPMTCTLSRL